MSTINNTILFLHNLHNIIQGAVHCGADLDENVAGDDGAVFAHLGDGGDADAGFFGEFFLFHIAVDQKFKEFLIACSHCMTPHKLKYNHSILA